MILRQVSVTLVHRLILNPFGKLIKVIFDTRVTWYLGTPPLTCALDVPSVQTLDAPHLTPLAALLRERAPYLHASLLSMPVEPAYLAFNYVPFSASSRFMAGFVTFEAVLGCTCEGVVAVPSTQNAAGLFGFVGAITVSVAIFQAVFALNRGVDFISKVPPLLRSQTLIFIFSLHQIFLRLNFGYHLFPNFPRLSRSNFFIRIHHFS